MYHVLLDLEYHRINTETAQSPVPAEKRGPDRFGLRLTRAGIPCSEAASDGWRHCYAI